MSEEDISQQSKSSPAHYQQDSVLSSSGDRALSNPNQWEQSEDKDIRIGAARESPNNGKGARAAAAIVREVREEVRRKDPALGFKQRSTKDDPNFMESFFRASRLHFIGSWKARYQKFLDALPPTPPLPPPLPGNHRLVFHIDMDCFFCSVAIRGRPELQGLPVAVCWGDASSENAHHAEISSANYEARKYGLRAGMFIGKAKELCPQLITLPYEFDKYAETAEALYRTIFRTTPHVQGVSVDEAFADMTALVSALDTAQVSSVAAALRQQIFEATGCTASIGSSVNRYENDRLLSSATPRTAEVP